MVFLDHGQNLHIHAVRARPLLYEFFQSIFATIMLGRRIPDSGRCADRHGDPAMHAAAAVGCQRERELAGRRARCPPLAEVADGRRGGISRIRR